ncbi:unnamed protein product [Brassica oleracea]|uniref:(rape) hypothetical protein n=2 Tax=Brassica napus TaxID=3708 RepID=A0A816MP20_BRANA|nr:unnamed protein product [Brassica napus]
MEFLLILKFFLEPLIRDTVGGGLNVLLKSITHPRSTFNVSFIQARRWNCDYKKAKDKVTDIRTGAAKLKEASEADFHGATTPIKKIVNANWPKNSNQFSKSFRKLRDLQLKEKLHILMWSLKIYLPVIMHMNWILNL